VPTLSAGTAVARAVPPADPGPLTRSGFFKRGINIDLLELGSIQAIGRGGTASGLLLGIGPEFDLGPRAAIRVALQFGFAAKTSASTWDQTQASSFFDLVLAPGFFYRFRYQQDQRWVPYLGGAVDLGLFQFGRELLGLEPSPAGTSQAFVRLGLAPQLLGGVVYCPTRIFSLRLAAGDTYFLVASKSLHVLSESVSARFSF